MDSLIPTSRHNVPKSIPFSTTHNTYCLNSSMSCNCQYIIMQGTMTLASVPIKGTTAAPQKFGTRSSCARMASCRLPQVPNFARANIRIVLPSIMARVATAATKIQVNVLCSFVRQWEQPYWKLHARHTIIAVRMNNCSSMLPYSYLGNTEKVWN